MGLASTRTCVGMICVSAVLVIAMVLLTLSTSLLWLRISLLGIGVGQLIAIVLFVMEYRRLDEIERARPADD